MRIAEYTDVPALVAIGSLIAAEAKPAPLPFSAETRTAWLRAMMRLPNFVCFIEGDPIIGAILGACVPNADEPNYIEAIAEYLWVAPEHRQSRTALRLIAAFRDWGRQRGARALFFASSTGADLSTLARLVGADEIGRSYRLPLAPWH